jgi:superfamily II DNA or RNA helicase
MAKELRKYQQESIDAVKKDMDKGTKSSLLVLATGLGKTFTAVKLIEQLGFKRVLFITHTIELIEQSGLAFIKDKFDDNFAKVVEDIGFLDWASGAGGLFAQQQHSFRMGAIKAHVFNIDGEVTMASAQTLYRRLDKIPKNYFDCIIADEVHLYLSRTFSEPLNYFTPKLLLGLTATPHRADGISLGTMFEKISYEYNIAEGIKDGYLAQLDAVRIKTDLSLDNVRTTGGELNQGDLQNEVDTEQRNQLIVDSYIKYANGRQAIMFCVGVEHADNLARMFNEHGISAKPVVGNEEITPEREKTIKDFKNGKIQILTGVDILTAGFDHRNVGCIGHCAPTKSLTRWLQRTGRGTRLKDEEYVSKFGQVAIIMDFVDSTTRHRLINAWELDKGKSTEEKTFMTKEKKDRLIGEREKRQVLIKVTSKEDIVVDLLEIPKVSISNSIRMQEPATEKQLNWIAKLGYDIINVEYTKRMCSEIISSLPAQSWQISKAKAWGYDVSNGLTISEFQEIEKRVLNKEQKAIVQQHTPNNGGNPFF